MSDKLEALKTKKYNPDALITDAQLLKLKLKFKTLKELNQIIDERKKIEENIRTERLVAREERFLQFYQR